MARRPASGNGTKEKGRLNDWRCRTKFLFVVYSSPPSGLNQTFEVIKDRFAGMGAKVRISKVENAPQPGVSDWVYYVLAISESRFQIRDPGRLTVGNYTLDKIFIVRNGLQKVWEFVGTCGKLLVDELPQSPSMKQPKTRRCPAVCTIHGLSHNWDKISAALDLFKRVKSLKEDGMDKVSIFFTIRQCNTRGVRNNVTDHINALKEVTRIECPCMEEVKSQIEGVFEGDFLQLLDYFVEKETMIDSYAGLGQENRGLQDIGRNFLEGFEPNPQETFLDYSISFGY